MRCDTYIQHSIKFLNTFSIHAIEKKRTKEIENNASWLVALVSGTCCDNSKRFFFL